MKDDARLSRERTIWELRTTKSLTQAQIANQLQLSQGQVSRILNRVREKMRQSTAEEVELEKYVQLDTLRLIVAQNLEAWEKSKKPKKRVGRTEKFLKPGKQPGAPEPDLEAQDKEVATSQAVEEVAGDPRYLDMAMKAMAEIRMLLGMNAPTKIAFTDPTGKQGVSPFQVNVIKVRDYVALEREQADLVEGTARLLEAGDAVIEGEVGAADGD